MANFTSDPGPVLRHGEETDILPKPFQYTHAGSFREVIVLPGESLGALAKRVFGANTELNRQRILANNGVIKGKVKIPNV